MIDKVFFMNFKAIPILQSVSNAYLAKKSCPCQWNGSSKEPTVKFSVCDDNLKIHISLPLLYHPAETLEYKHSCKPKKKEKRNVKAHAIFSLILYGCIGARSFNCWVDRIMATGISRGNTFIFFRNLLWKTLWIWTAN